MPTYEYRCTSCSDQFEIVQSFKDASLKVCEKCQGELRKVYGNVGISFKGTGFYKNDSKPSTGTSGGSSGSTGASGSSDSTATKTDAGSSTSTSTGSESSSSTPSSSPSSTGSSHGAAAPAAAAS